ncbi:hypothetical protein [Deinococcus peraridilitoris]|uniref:Uncharacterized protein n=1 Tax=Deinococcus peraridilitoris (strain DSM 19664 / LMG 22246 / CIP 109416 / KR-200) TaxID=937777 RepID=L0A0I5_DEIPD|nr:hypothetical protein [Deinococcus peraridilitoris]AFZ66667.1 hypothetical protein Deipe_1105 [Deinococcus peraridilitoris DSM 19664]
MNRRFDDLRHFVQRTRLWRWLTTPDPAPGFTLKKVGRLFAKSLLFALIAVSLQLLLRALGLEFVDTTWGTLLVVLLVYIPFARILSVDFAPPPPRARPGGKSLGSKAGTSRVKKRKYAGVKKSGPRL